MASATNGQDVANRRNNLFFSISPANSGYLSSSSSSSSSSSNQLNTVNDTPPKYNEILLTPTEAGADQSTFQLPSYSQAVVKQQPA